MMTAAATPLVHVHGYSKTTVHTTVTTYSSRLVTCDLLKRFDNSSSFKLQDWERRVTSQKSLFFKEVQPCGPML